MRGVIESLTCNVAGEKPKSKKRTYRTKHGTVATMNIPTREKAGPVSEPKEDNGSMKEPEFEIKEVLAEVLDEMRHFQEWGNKAERDKMIARFNAAYDKENYDERS